WLRGARKGPEEPSPGGAAPDRPASFDLEAPSGAGLTAEPDGNPVTLRVGDFGGGPRGERDFDSHPAARVDPAVPGDHPGISLHEFHRCGGAAHRAEDCQVSL